MNKILYIVNPISGGGRGLKIIPQIKNFHKDKSTHFNIIQTEYPKHATEISKIYCHEYDKIVSVGGDGTLNEIINGLKLNSDILLGVLPIGTGNDFVKNFDIGNNITDILFMNYTSNNFISIDLGKIIYFDVNNNTPKTHLFINSLGIGFDAYVSYLKSNNSSLQGIFAYLVAIVKALIKFEMLNFKVKTDSFSIDEEKLMLNVGNGKSSGGGFYLTPKANLSDNILDLTLIDKVTRLRLLSALPKAIINKIETVKEVKMYKFKNLSLELDKPYYLHCDGEIITEIMKKAEIQCLDNVIKIISK